MDAVRISLSGLDVEWQRLQVAAQNLANMNSTSADASQTFRALRLVSGPDGPFATLLTANRGRAAPAGVRVMSVEAQENSVRRVHEPGSPHADEDGFVTYPNIDHAAEMTLMIRASRAYEANLAAMSIAQEMYAHALDMGRQA